MPGSNEPCMTPATERVPRPRFPSPALPRSPLPTRHRTLSSTTQGARLPIHRRRRCPLRRANPCLPSRRARKSARGRRLSNCPSVRNNARAHALRSPREGVGARSPPSIATTVSSANARSPEAVRRHPVGALSHCRSALHRRRRGPDAAREAPEKRCINQRDACTSSRGGTEVAAGAATLIAFIRAGARLANMSNRLFHSSGLAAIRLRGPGIPVDR